MLRCSVSDDGDRCSACLRLQEVQSKIRECKELLEKLYMQEAHTKSSVNAVHDPIIRNLPLELVSNILTLCNPSPVEDDEEFGSLPPDAPLATRRYQISLGTVCKTWRNIVRSTPQLWTSIYIRFPTKRDKLQQKELLLLSLRLSGSLPLHIQAWMRRDYRPSEGEHLVLSPLVEMLNDQSERWKTLDLHVTIHLLSQFKGGAFGAQTLERLRVYPFGLPNDINGFRVSFGLPSPQIVNARRTSFSSIGISWKGVTRVKINTLTATECLGLFQVATQLVNLSIGLLGCDDFHPPNSGEVITASNLASWKVELSAGSDVMLNKLVLPSLVDLDVRKIISLESNSLERLVSRSKCPLRKISVTQAPGVELDVMPLLRVTPLLEKLVFSCGDSGGIHELLDILARTKLVNDISEDPNMMFLPHLENLSFIGVQDDSPPWHVVPSLFPPTGTWPPANSQYRPLRRLEFRIYTDLEVEPPRQGRVATTAGNPATRL